MDDKQKINCTVGSCQFHDDEKHECELNEITVEPCFECDTGDPEEESMCGNYTNADEKK
ncbi:MAG: DUF1540 domain-containing protein [Oscillospiraceae bacterium]|nr:DUF1540 domain-containing protein [Oscillospiraceae bacterium]